MEQPNEGQGLPSAPCKTADVEPVYLGRHRHAAQSKRHGAIFRQRSRAAPDVAVWPAIPIHLLGGLALLVGFYTRWAAALLALVCLGTAFGVHLPAGDPANMINFYKNLVMTGGFLFVIAFGPGGLSFHREAA